jgi:FtsH-binding integral membrane protein
MKRTKQIFALLGLALFAFAVGPLWIQFTTTRSARAILVSPLYWGLILLATVSFFGTAFLIKNYGGDSD